MSGTGKTTLANLVGSSKNQLYDLGSATISITPKSGVDLYALDGMKRNSNHRHSELYANAVTIGLQKKQDLLIIVSLDLIWVDKILTEKIRKWVNSYYDQNKIHLMLVATHSHSTPQISNKFCNSARPDSLYLSFLYDQICKVIEKALKSQEKCYAKLTISRPNLAVNRRKRILSLAGLKRGLLKTKIANRPNFNEVCDDFLYSVWFYSEKDEEKAVLLNYACHPTLFRENAISSDYPGEVSCYLKKQVSEKLVVCFLQGFTGNIKANITQRSCFHYRGLFSYIYSCLFDRVQFNKSISPQQLKSFSVKLAMSSLERKKEKFINPQLFFSNTIVKLPLQAEQGGRHANLEISYISIGDKLRLITVGGEVFSEYSTWLRKILSSNGVDILTVGYCNDMVGYIPTQKAIKEGGYEVERTFTEFALPSPFLDKIESKIKSEIEKLIKISLIEK
jgi:hypothetical protein